MFKTEAERMKTIIESCEEVIRAAKMSTYEFRDDVGGYLKDATLGEIREAKHAYLAECAGQIQEFANA